jgi:hypothetical protein
MNHQAIYNTHPTVVSIDDGKGAMDANGNPVAIDQSLIDAEVARLQAEQAATQYQRDRAAAYASIGDQLDMQYWDALNDTTTWADHVAEIKARFPK